MSSAKEFQFRQNSACADGGLQDGAALRKK